MVALALGQGDAIPALWFLLDEKPEPELSSNAIIQPIDQCGAEQCLVLAVRETFIEAIDEIDRRHVRITTDREVPSFVAKLDAIRPPILAEWPISQVFDASRRQWTPIGIDGLRESAPRHVEGVGQVGLPEPRTSTSDAI